jgi:hypothetical protein
LLDVPPAHAGLAAGKFTALAHLSTPKKAGAGAVALLALAGIGFGAIRATHPVKPPTPPPAPAPVNPQDPNAGRNTQLADGSTLPDPNAAAPAADPNAPAVVTVGPLIDAGTPIVIRLDHDVNSDTATPGQLLPATVVSPVTEAGNVVVPTGAKAHLRVIGVDRSGLNGGAAHVQLALVDVATGSGRVHVSTYAKSFDGPVSTKQVKHAGLGAAIGAGGGFVVGKLFHHGKDGAIAGAAGGAAYGAASTKPDPVKVGAATVIHFKLAKAAVQS